MNNTFQDQVLAAFEAARHTSKLTNPVCVLNTGNLDTPATEAKHRDVEFEVSRHSNRTDGSYTDGGDTLAIEFGSATWGGHESKVGLSVEAATKLALAILEVVATEITPRS